MNLRTRWRLPGAPLIGWSLVFALLFTAMSAQAHYDELSDEEQCALGHTEHCPAPPANTPMKAEPKKRDNTAVVSANRASVSVKREIDATCPTLPPSVAVFGYGEGTQCQMVDGAGVGKKELVERGIISAVDVWGFVFSGIEVCFRNSGALVFLDAAYAPRMIVELESFERDGMTCGAIDGAGTVVLVQSSPAPDPDATPVAHTLPTIDSIPLNDCQIKLTETLFLRDQPAGEIIGLVWQFSEVAAFEINGFWYKIEFEGQTGFVSRYHRKVLRGGCS